MELNKNTREEMLKVLHTVIVKCPARFGLSNGSDCMDVACIDCWKKALEDSLKEEE